jgi:hypothetical protein
MENVCLDKKYGTLLLREILSQSSMLCPNRSAIINDLEESSRGAFLAVL